MLDEYLMRFQWPKRKIYNLSYLVAIARPISLVHLPILKNIIHFAHLVKRSTLFLIFAVDFVLSSSSQIRREL